MPDVNMPKLSDTMEEGTVLEWKKQDGEEVHRGEVLAEIESDKASFEIEAEADGVLHITVEKGQAVPVGQLIGRIGGEAPAAAPAAPAAPEKPAAREPAPEPAPPPRPSPAGEEGARAEAAPPRRVAENGADRVKASPLARRLAGEMGVDLTAVRGSGPEGRIVKEDVLAAAERSGATMTAPSPTARPRPAGPEVEIVEPNRMQATIARRMIESKTTVPHFYVTVEAR